MNTSNTSDFLAPSPLQNLAAMLQGKKYFGTAGKVASLLTSNDAMQANAVAQILPGSPSIFQRPWVPRETPVMQAPMFQRPQVNVGGGPLSGLLFDDGNPFGAYLQPQEEE